MPRIAGVDVPKEKRIEISLTYIHGIGRSLANRLLQEAKIDPNVKARDLSDSEVSKLSSMAQKNYKVEGELRREVSANIKRLMDIGTYRGLRHKKSLPVRGQRTHTNARTRKGPRKTVRIMKKESVKGRSGSGKG